MKQQITAAERLQVAGLLALAAHHDEQMQAIQRALLRLFGTTEAEIGVLGSPAGHLQDAMWEQGRRDVDTLLERLKVRVEEEQ